MKPLIIFVSLLLAITGLIGVYFPLQRFSPQTEENKIPTLAEINNELETCTIDSASLIFRPLVLPDPLDPVEALKRLFGGHYQSIASQELEPDRKYVIWRCKEKCLKLQYKDYSNHSIIFPDDTVWDTELLADTLALLAADGNTFGFLFFNTRIYSISGNLHSAWEGGLLGCAVFLQADNVWRLVGYQPALFYGGFSGKPTAPKPIALGAYKIGFLTDQYIHCPGCCQTDRRGQLWALEGAGFRPVSDTFKLASSNSSVYFWESDLQPIKTEQSHEFYDFIQTNKGECNLTNETFKKLCVPMYRFESILAELPPAAADYYRKTRRPFGFSETIRFKLKDGGYQREFCSFKAWPIK